MKISYHAVSDVGRKRKGNEDSYVVEEAQGLFVVADGMGGHAAGEVASRIAVETIREFVAVTAGDDDITWPFGLDDSMSWDGNRLKTAIQQANRHVLEATRGRSEYDGMATTVAAALVRDDVATLAHVGDSRVYLWRDGALAQLTSDHSWVNEQLLSGLISSETARHHPLRNVVTRALGGRSELQVDVQAQELRDGDRMLLCSDGLTTMVPDPEIASILGGGHDVERTAMLLVEVANEHGGDDNVSVIVIAFSAGE